MDIKNEIIKAIDERFKVLKDSLKFDRTYYGQIVSISNNKAIVNINGQEYNARLVYGLNVIDGDIVIAKAPNNNFSYLYIEHRLI